MRNSALILLMIIFQMKIYSQGIDSSNVYLQALKIHISHKDEIYKNNPELKFSDVLYLEENEFTTNKIPELILGKKINIVNQEEIYSLTKSNKLVSIISIKPAKWKNGSLRIAVIDFFVIRNRKKVAYTNVGGSEFEIKDFTLKELNRIHGNYD